MGNNYIVHPKLTEHCKSIVIEKKNALKQITGNYEIHHPNNKRFNPDLKKKSYLELFNFVPHGQVAIQTGSQMVWCSRFLKRPLLIKDVMVKEHAMLIEEDISGRDQKMFPNVEQANDECKNGFEKKTATKLQSRL